MVLSGVASRGARPPKKMGGPCLPPTASLHTGFFFSFFVPWFLYLGNFHGNKRQTRCFMGVCRPPPQKKKPRGALGGLGLREGKWGDTIGIWWGVQGSFAFAFPRGWRGPFLGVSGTPPPLFVHQHLGDWESWLRGERVGRGPTPVPPKGQGGVWPRWGWKTWWGGVAGSLSSRGGGRTSGPSSTGPGPARSAASGSSARGALGVIPTGVWARCPPGISSELPPSCGSPTERDEGSAAGLPVPTSPPSPPQSRGGGNAESALPRGQVPLLWSRR